MKNVLDGYITEDELAIQLGRHVRSLKRWRSEGLGPPATIFGRSIYFRAEAVRDWLHRKTHAAREIIAHKDSFSQGDECPLTRNAPCRGASAFQSRHKT